MPKFLEDKLKAEYPGNPSAVYGTLNALGYMHGNKETASGKAAEVKHTRDVKAGKASGMVRAARHPGKNLGAHLRPRKGR